MKTVLVQIDHGDGTATQRGIHLNDDGTVKVFELAVALSAGDAKKATDALDAAKAVKVTAAEEPDPAQRS